MSDITIIGIDPDNLEIKGFAKELLHRECFNVVEGWAHRWVALSPHLQELTALGVAFALRFAPRAPLR